VLLGRLGERRVVGVVPVGVGAAASSQAGDLYWQRRCPVGRDSDYRASGERLTAAAPNNMARDFHTSGVMRGRAQPPRIADILGAADFGGGLMATSTDRER
jgi:hypothetical protein